MTLYLPVDVEASIRAFVATGQFATEVEVLRAALAALQRQKDALAAIMEGLDDEAAGRVTPARQIVGAAKQGLARTTE